MAEDYREQFKREPRGGIDGLRGRAIGRESRPEIDRESHRFDPADGLYDPLRLHAGDCDVDGVGIEADVEAVALAGQSARGLR